MKHCLCCGLFCLSSSRSAVHYPTAWNGDLEKLIVAQLVNTYPAFCATQTFSYVFTEPATGPYPELVESYLHPVVVFL